MKRLLLVASLSAAWAGTSDLAAQDVTVCYENLTTDPRTFWIPLPGQQPRFESLDGMLFVERSDGTATLTGAVANLNNPLQRFSVEFNLSGLVSPGDAAHPPAGSPFLTNFIINNSGPGGAIDLSTWRYYTSMTGTLTGRRDYEGAVLTTTGVGAPYQVGNGANTFELGESGAGWFSWTLVSQPDNGMNLPLSGEGDSNGLLGNNCICFGGQEAIAVNYGTGTAGCAGVPSLTSQLPLTGLPISIEIGNANAMTLDGALLWSLNSASINDPFLGGLRLVDPIVDAVTLSIPPGGTFFNCFVPNISCQIGTTFYAQAVALETCAPNGFSLSRGLQITIGDL